MDVVEVNVKRGDKVQGDETLAVARSVIASALGDRDI